MRYRTLLAYRFPPNPAAPDGFVEGFASEDDSIPDDHGNRATAIALAKVSRKLKMLEDIHGVPMPYESSRLLITADDKKKISPAELKQLRDDWRVSLASNLV